MSGPSDAPGPHAGLVIAWEKRDTTWFALVAYFLEPDQVLVQQWLPANLLAPADQ